MEIILFTVPNFFTLQFEIRKFKIEKNIPVK